MLTGQRPIVVNIRNSYQFHEHENVEGAKQEAHRLALSVGSGEFVVYVPVAVVARTPQTTEQATAFASDIGALVPLPDPDVDLPF